MCALASRIRSSLYFSSFILLILASFILLISYGPYADVPAGLFSGDKGVLEVTSNPSDAWVFIEGLDTKRSRTPKNLSVPAGTYVLTVMKTGYRDWNGDVTVSAYGLVKVHADLYPAPVVTTMQSGPTTTLSTDTSELRSNPKTETLPDAGGLKSAGLPAYYTAHPEFCDLPGDEDGDGLSDCSDADCAKGAYCDIGHEKACNNAGACEIVPFIIISTCEGLQSIRLNTSANYDLAGDIDCEGTVNWNGGAGFEPVKGFSGILDGRGYGITGLYINRGGSSEVGLFSSTDGAMIQNISLMNAYVAGASMVGGLAGLNRGTILNAAFAGKISGNGDGVGGIAGSNEGLIAYSRATVEIYSSGNNVGGLAGTNDIGGVIKNSGAVGDAEGIYYVGGLAGYSRDAILNSYADVDVRGDISVGGLVGGAVGGLISGSHAAGDASGYYSIGGLVGDGSKMTVMDSYSTGAVNGYGDVGGLVGRAALSRIENTYASGEVYGKSNAGGLIGYLSGEAINSYSTGDIRGGEDNGGLVGYNRGSMTGCYWNKKPAGNKSCVGIGSSKGCSQIEDNERYFQLASNPPMSGWGYPPWSGRCNSICNPSLAWEGGCSCAG
ncbi:MAG: GLUG motif-containing protein [Candidatus Altiarchaeota archaeon]|nr:GLUG motif-containing protein [Candidatus Altiarchaeota archaeon]